MEVVLSVKSEKAKFILLESKKKFKLIQTSISELYVRRLGVFDTYEEAKKYLFELL